jgi:hypothetical protein
MKVFISWSGLESQKMAESLRSWLKYVIQTIDPFVSSLDIAKGDRGLRVIASQLEKTSFGILCVTRENSLAPWINFEAGALSKAVGEDTRVIPCLLDMPVSDLTGPLAQFQAVSSANKDEVFSMVRALRDHSDLADLDDSRLRTIFDAFWPTLENDLEAARSLKGNTTAVKSVREPAEILEEVLVLARRQESVLRTIVERVDSSVPMLEFRRGITSTSDNTEARRSAVDELIADLNILGDRALTYRIITDRVPEEIQVVYDVDAISAENVDDVLARIGDFVTRKRVHVTIKSADGYDIIAGPGKKAAILLSPAEVTIGDSDPEANK